LWTLTADASGLRARKARAALSSSPFRWSDLLLISRFENS
jgi:hypothetical protein